MDNTIGKKCYVLLSVFLIFRIWTVPIDLKIKSLEGEPIEQAGVGVPFLLSVTCSGRDKPSKPHIAGLDSFQVQTAGMFTHSTGRDTTTTYAYKVRIDTPGSYVIGPASVEIENKKSTSKAVRIKVGEKPIIDPAHAKAAKAPRAFIRLSTNKTYAFVGERIECEVRFYGLPQVTKLERIEEPKIVHAELSEKEGPLVSAETVDGTEYSVVTFKWAVYAQKEGQLVIPACAGDFLEEEAVDSYWAHFSPFFGRNFERKRTYSNATTVTIEALPPHKGPVNAVGIFKHFEAKISPSVALEGEGMVLTLELEGEGDLQRLEIPKLIGVPAGLKWYDSKQYIKDVKGIHGLPVKCFEYIVQGLTAGNWKIPAQSFEYFDVAKKGFAKLVSDELPVNIKPIASTPTVTVEHDKKEDQHVVSEPQMLPLNMKGALRQVRPQRMMPWWLFFACAMLPIIVGMYAVMRFIIHKQFYYIHRKLAFKKARARIGYAESHNDAALLHTIFVELFEMRTGTVRTRLSQDTIESMLLAKGLIAYDVGRWNDFYNRVYERAFFDVSGRLSDGDIFKEAMQWIALLEKFI